MKKTVKKVAKKTAKKVDSIKLKTIVDKEDPLTADISVDGKFSIHVKRTDEGYAIDCYTNDGRIFNGSETTIWNEDLEGFDI